MNSRNGHPTAAALEGYRERALSPTEYLEVGGHISGCPECQAQVADPADLRAALSLSGLDLVRERVHLTYEQLDALSENALSLTERRPLARHVERCDACAIQLEELRAFKAELSAAPEAPAPAAPWWSAILALISRPEFLMPVGGLAAAGLASLAIFGLVVSPMRNTEKAMIRQQVQTQGELDQTQGERREALAQVSQLTAKVGELQGKSQAAEEARKQLTVAQSDLKAAKERADQLERQLKDHTPSSPVLAFRDDDKLKVTSLGGEPVVPLDKADAEILRSGQLAMNVAPDLSRLAALPKGGGHTFAIQGPVATAVQSPTPTLRWSALSGADGYEVRLRDLGTQQPAGESERIPATEWKVPEALKDGHRYSWEVTAFHDTDEIGTAPLQPALAARFQVLTAAQREQVSQELKKAGPAHFARAKVYARAGLREDAHQELELLLKDNPDSPSVKKLLERTQPNPGDKASPVLFGLHEHLIQRAVWYRSDG